MVRKYRPSRACNPPPKTKKFKLLWKTFQSSSFCQLRYPKLQCTSRVSILTNSLHCRSCG